MDVAAVYQKGPRLQKELKVKDLTHRDAIVNGVRLHYVEAGEGSLVVLLHGFPEFWYSWRFQIPALASAGFHVIAPDLRGYNKSAKPIGIHQYEIDVLADDIVGLIRHVGEQSAVVTGHDWGGAIAWSLAKDHPEVVKRLIILNAPHPAAFRRELGTFGQLWKSWYIFFFQLPWLPEAAFRAFDYALLERTLRRDLVHTAIVTEDDIAAYKAAFSEPGALTAAINYYRAAARISWRRDSWRSTRIAIPTLVIWGKQDRYLGLALLEGLHRWVPKLRVETISNASHWVQMEAHERVNQLMLGFLKES